VVLWFSLARFFFDSLFFFFLVNKACHFADRSKVRWF